MRAKYEEQVADLKTLDPPQISIVLIGEVHLVGTNDFILTPRFYGCSMSTETSSVLIITIHGILKQ